MIDLTKVSEEELLNHDIHWLRNGIGWFPVGYDSEGAIVDAMERRGEKDRHMISVRLGLYIGYQEGFRIAAKHACDALGLKHRWDSVQTEIKTKEKEK